MPVIDIALAAYRGDHYIVEQLHSIFSNQFPDQDICLGNVIVSDNLSPDRTSEIVRELSARYRNLHLLSNSEKGVIANFNHALAATAAPYVMLADQDDVWMRDKIHLTFQRMRQLEQEYGQDVPLLVFTDLAVTDDGLNVTAPSFFAFQKILPAQYRGTERMFLYNIAPGCTMMANRCLLEMALPVPSGAVMHDWWLMQVAAVFGQVAYVDRATMYYRQHQNNQIGAKVSSFWEKLFSPLEKYRLAQKNLQDASRQASLFLAQFPDVNGRNKAVIAGIAQFESLSRWQRIRKLAGGMLVSPTFWGQVLLYAVAMFMPVTSQSHSLH